LFPCDKSDLYVGITWWDALTSHQQFYSQLHLYEES